jgi:hypothetical protein
MSDAALAEMRELAITDGQRLAQKMFDKRGKGQTRTEIHVDQATLAAMLAIAFERGYEARDAKPSDGGQQ